MIIFTITITITITTTITITIIIITIITAIIVLKTPEQGRVIQQNYDVTFLQKKHQVYMKAGEKEGVGR